MKVKPKEIMVNLPIVLMFNEEDEIYQLASSVNTFIHGKVKVKCEFLGTLGSQCVGLFYLQRNDEFSELREQFMQMIEREECNNSSAKECKHNWVMDGHNAGGPICSECFKEIDDE